jgi:spermidine/putrescine transport system ATP-binding protein
MAPNDPGNHPETDTSWLDRSLLAAAGRAQLGEAAVELIDVVKRFSSPGGGTVTAVDRVSLEIRNGEFFSLLGPSGCGKTTTLRMIGGFEWPTAGEIIIQGKPAGKTAPYSRPVNTVFQSYALFQHMTIFQNVAFGL